MKRDIEIKPSAETEIAALPARFRAPVIKAIDSLEHQADAASKHRHPMSGSFVPYWQVEVGAIRIYYLFDAEVEAVRVKGNKRTEVGI